MAETITQIESDSFEALMNEAAPGQDGDEVSSTEAVVHFSPIDMELLGAIEASSPDRLNHFAARVSTEVSDPEVATILELAIMNLAQNTSTNYLLMINSNSAAKSLINTSPTPIC